VKAKYKAGEHVRNVRMVYATPMLLTETPGTIVRASEHRGTQARYLVAFDDVRTGPRNLWVDQDQLERMRKANPRRKRRPKRSRYDRLVAHSRNPRKRRAFAYRVRGAGRRRARNPRSPLFKLLAQRRGGKRLVYLGGVKFAEKGRPVYFKSPEGARTVAKLLRLQFPMLRKYAFGVAGA
jgi:hypothetical protein